MAVALVQSLYQSPYVSTPVNLKAFLKWAAIAEKRDLDIVMPVVCLVWHSDGNDHRDPHVLGEEVRRPDLNKSYNMRDEDCEDDNCQRCAMGKGGYTFNWVGPWTCPMTIGDAVTSPSDVYRAMMGCPCGRH